MKKEIIIYSILALVIGLIIGYFIFSNNNSIANTKTINNEDSISCSDINAPFVRVYSYGNYLSADVVISGTERVGYSIGHTEKSPEGATNSVFDNTYATTINMISPKNNGWDIEEVFVTPYIKDSERICNNKKIIVSKTEFVLISNQV